MIAILSKSRNELTTNEVIDWLYNFNQKCLRINCEDLENEDFSLEIESTNDVTKTGFCELLTKSDVIWYRMWYTGEIDYFNSMSAQVAARYFEHIKNEIGVLSNFLFNLSQNATWLDFPKSTRLNKMEVLIVAKECGLNIPETILTNNLNDVIEFLKKHEIIITKPICEVFFLSYKNYEFLSHTKAIDNNNISILPKKFFPSLFQTNILKKYEIRIFFLNNQIYSMAIFSQKDNQTQEDFRNYNRTKPNRFVPYVLPDNICKSIIKLMKKMNLKTGSIDLIKSANDNKYYFLEINPSGQFGMVSKPCNYYLEKKMAEYLVHLNNKNNGKN